MFEYTTRQKGDSKVTVVRCRPGGREQAFMMREPIGEEIKMSHFTKVTISDLKRDPKLRIPFSSDWMPTPSPPTLCSSCSRVSAARLPRALP